MEESWKDYYHPSSIQEYNPKNLFQDFPTRSKAQITPLSSLISKDHNNAQNDNILVDGSYKNILNSPYEASVNVTTCPSSLSAKNKRVFDDHHHNMIENGGDHVVDSRYKRMIKNRDSAARSRARKQAYTSQLERECADLKEDNAKLRRQQEQILASAPAHVHLKCNHSRSLTAPF